MISSRELETLQSFDGNGHIMLSAYLRLDTPQCRESAYSEFVRQMQVRLEECGPRPDCRQAIQEDMEIVGVYLRTNGHRQHAGIAIFSCAAEFFWRAFPLTQPVPTRISVGPRFDLDPLLKIHTPVS